MTASNSTSQLESEPGVFPMDTMANSILSVSETVTSPASSEEHHDSTTHHASNRHTRLDSIHLSSDASGETSMASHAADFSTHSFIDSGEGATELRNARNPPWSHGVTGTPILHRGLTEHTDTLDFLDGRTGEIPSHEEISSPHLSATDSQNLVQDQVLTPRPSVKHAQDSPSSSRQIAFQVLAAKSTPNRIQPSSSPLYVSSSSPHPPSPFDSHHAKRSPTSLRPTIVHLNSPIAHVNSLSVRGTTTRPQNGTFTAHVSAPAPSNNLQPSNGAWREAAGLKTPFQPLVAQAPSTRVVSNGSAAGSGASGEVSSEEEEAWPMPQTPFISSENWPQGKAANGKSSVAPVSLAPVDHSARRVDSRDTPATHTPLLPSKLSPSIGNTPHGRIQVSGGGRAPPRGLISHNGAKEGQRRVGRCKMYNCDKGVGFLIDDDLEEVPYDVKIHWTDLYSDQEFKSLAKGEVVEYTLNLTSNGYSASYVTGPGGRPVMGAEFTIVQASRQTSYKLFKAGALPVKTYRSKWEGVPSPAGFLESPETPLGGSAHRALRSPLTPGSAAVGGLATPASGIYGLLAKPMKVKLPGASEVGVASLPQVTSKPPGTISTPNLVQPSSRQNQSVHANHVAPTDQSLAWNYPSPQTFLSGFNSAYRPLLPALVRNNPATPNQPLAQYEAMLLGSYATQPITSPSAHFSTNGMQPAASTIPFNMHALLAERHLLLQQQAALMALYQKSASQSLGLTQAAPLSHGQVSSLLPPISLPTSNTPAPDQVRTEASSWRSAPTLRPNAQAFSPALESKAANPAQVEPVAEEPRTESLVYQPPGRRTVSDPKPNSLLVHKRNLIGNKSTELPAAPRGYKRVTFAEEPARARRVVSYGETDDDEDRVAQRVTSVDIAMERLREAGAPRRLSVLSNNHPNLLGEDAAWMIPAN